MYTFPMVKGRRLTKKDIIHLSNLSQLTLSDSEIDVLAGKLEETVKYIENIAEVDTKGFEGAYHSTDNTNVYRQDEVDPIRQFDQKTALRNASKTMRGTFVVDRILNET